MQYAQAEVVRLERAIVEHVKTEKLYADHPKIRCNRLGEGYVYAIAFCSGTVKVGKTTSPDHRLARYKQTAAMHGDSILNLWMSSSHPQFERNERSLIAFCASRGERVAGREYFRGVPFAGVLEFAQSLSYFSFADIGIYHLGPDATVADVKAACAQMAEITEYLQWKVDHMSAQLDQLVAAVDGDLSAVWQDAEDALRRADGQD